jgi:galactose mutarotase-like enzyme
MSVSHREHKRGDRLLDILIDEQNGLRIILSRFGAELISIARRDAAGDWVGFLYRDNDLSKPASGWANHATVMGYYLHRLKNERSLYRGSEVRGGTHSFLRTKNWHLASLDTEQGHSLTYSITQRDFTSTEYPLNVSVNLSYALNDGSLEVRFQLTNHEPELTAHVGFGLHPGFGASSFDAFSFRMPRGKYRRHLAPNNYLSGETEEFEFTGGEMPFDRAKLSGSYILEFLDVPDRRFTYTDPLSGRAVILDLCDVPYLTLWSDGGPFLCVEPCWGLTDYHDQRSFEEKEGIQKIAPGSTLENGFSIQPQLIAAS